MFSQSFPFPSCFPQPVLQATVSNQGLVQGSAPQLQTTKMETAPSQQLANHNQLLQVSRATQLAAFLWEIIAQRLLRVCHCALPLKYVENDHDDFPQTKVTRQILSSAQIPKIFSACSYFLVKHIYVQI